MTGKQRRSVVPAESCPSSDARCCPVPLPMQELLDSLDRLTEQPSLPRACRHSVSDIPCESGPFHFLGGTEGPPACFMEEAPGLPSPRPLGAAFSQATPLANNKVWASDEPIPRLLDPELQNKAGAGSRQTLTLFLPRAESLLW